MFNKNNILLTFIQFLELIYYCLYKIGFFKFNFSTKIFYFFYKKYKIIFEKKSIKFICKFIKQNSIVIDVGSNIGIYTYFFEKYSHATKIYSIEANRKNFMYLKKNFRNNKNIFILNKIVADRNKFFFLKNNISNPTGHFIDKKGEKIEGIKLDNFLKYNNKKISFIKIDVEGAEGLVIQGSKKILNKYKPTLYLEYAPERIARYGNFNLLKYLKDLKYNFYVEEKNLFKIKNIKQINKISNDKKVIDLLCHYKKIN